MKWVVTVGALASSIAVYGCSRCGADPRGSKSAAEEVPSKETAAGAEIADQGEPPQVRVRGEVLPSGEIALVVESHGEGPAKLAAEVLLEREKDGRFQPVDGVEELTLRYDCATQAEKCVTLISGAELRPPEWLGRMGNAQCDCDSCELAPEGRYRFVVRSCGGAHRIDGAPFDLER